MTMANAIQIERRPVSVKIQTVATVAAIVAAGVVPQFFHWLGTVSGAGKAPGVAFSPMHLPIIIVGLLAGWKAGAIAGLLGPVAAFALSGMPTAAQLPFMMIELFGYGAAAGLLRDVKMPLILKVLLAQIAGRVLRMAAVAIAIYAMGNESQKLFRVWTSIPSCLPRIVLQWTLIPLLVYWVENRKEN